MVGGGGGGLCYPLDGAGFAWCTGLAAWWWVLWLPTSLGLATSNGNGTEGREEGRQDSRRRGGTKGGYEKEGQENCLKSQFLHNNRKASSLGYKHNQH